MHKLNAALLAGLMLIGTAASAGAQTDTGEHEEHHAEEAQDTGEAPDTDATQPDATGEAPAAETPEGMSGMSGMSDMMGMMTPEMMQMMQTMHRMMGHGEMPGMMGEGHMSMATGMMMQMMMGVPGMLHGMPHGITEEMTEDRVRTFLEESLARHGNARLKIGEIATAEDGSITAEILTVDGSLVQKLAFNRYPGLFRQIP
jgi:hypothetical protein